MNSGTMSRFDETEERIAVTDKELKKLKRADLLRLLVEQSRQLEAVRAEAADTEAKLRAENQELRQQLDDRQIQISEAGSIAEAAMSLNGVVEAAQKAANQYLENIEQRSATQDSWLAELEAERKAKADRLLADAELECAEQRAATEKECAAQKAETEELCKNATNEAFDKIDAYWAGLSERLDSFYEAHMGLQKLLADGNMEPRFTSTMKQAVLMSGGNGGTK